MSCQRPTRPFQRPGLAFLLALALGAALIGCSGGDGGGGGCADGDDDGVCDDADLCPGTPAGCAVDDTGCPIEPCPAGAGDCSADFLGGQMDGTACFRDAAIPNDCFGPFRLLLLVSGDGMGAMDITVTTQDNPGGGSQSETPIQGVTCAADCSGDGTAFTCIVTDGEGNQRTIEGTIEGDEIDGTITTRCGGEPVAFSADLRADAECTPAP